MGVYNGTGPNYAPVNLWDKKAPLANTTNGMQFHPESNAGSISVYDNQF
jgi:hypothetical protein